MFDIGLIIIDKMVTGSDKKNQTANWMVGSASASGLRSEEDSLKCNYRASQYEDYISIPIRLILMLHHSAIIHNTPAYTPITNICLNQSS